MALVVHNQARALREGLIARFGALAVHERASEVCLTLSLLSRVYLNLLVGARRQDFEPRVRLPGLDGRLSRLFACFSALCIKASGWPSRGRAQACSFTVGALDRLECLFEDKIVFDFLTASLCYGTRHKLRSCHFAEIEGRLLIVEAVLFGDLRA